MSENIPTISKNPYQELLDELREEIENDRKTLGIKPKDYTALSLQDKQKLSAYNPKEVEDILENWSILESDKQKLSLDQAIFEHKRCEKFATQVFNYFCNQA